MICIFCNKENDVPRRWHIDCLDEAIEHEYGNEFYSLMLSSRQNVGTRVPEWIVELLKNGVEEGRRDKVRFILISYFTKHNMKQEDVTKMIFEFNDRCRPPENDRVIQNQLKYHLRRLDGQKNI